MATHSEEIASLFDGWQADVERLSAELAFATARHERALAALTEISKGDTAKGAYPLKVIASNHLRYVETEDKEQ